MSVFINGKFDEQTDAVIDIWSDTHRYSGEASTEDNFCVIKTVKVMPSFIEAERAIDCLKNHPHFIFRRTTSKDIQRMIDAKLYS